MTGFRAYVGPNWESHYGGQFRRLLDAELAGRSAGWTWNWPAALTPLWFLYRRLYVKFLVFSTLQLTAFAIGVAAAQDGGSGDPAAAFILILMVVQGYCADRALFDRALNEVRSPGRDATPERLALRGAPLAWVPFTPLVLFAGVMILGAMAAPRSSVLSRDSFRAPLAVREEAPATVVFGSGDGTVQITAPITWHTFQDLDASAKLQAGNEGADQFFMALTESREDLSPRVTLERYAEATLQRARKGLTDDTLSSSRTLTIQGHPAIQHVVRGTLDDARIVYWLTIVETPRSFHRVVAWTRASRAEANEPVFQAVIESFQDTSRDEPDRPRPKPAPDRRSDAPRPPKAASPPEGGKTR